MRSIKNPTPTTTTTTRHANIASRYYIDNSKIVTAIIHSRYALCALDRLRYVLKCFKIPIQHFQQILPHIVHL